MAKLPCTVHSIKPSADDLGTHQCARKAGRPTALGMAALDSACHSLLLIYALTGKPVPSPPIHQSRSVLPRLRAHWVRPEIVVHVGFIEWTVHGKLRHPRLLGLPPISPHARW